MNRTEFSLQLANYLVNQSGTNLAIIIENFLEENNIFLVNNEYIGGWSILDILYKAEELEVNLTKNEAYRILASIEDDFDASIGINWDTIEYYIQNYINSKSNIKLRS